MIRTTSNLEQLWMGNSKVKMIQMEILMMAMQVLILNRFQGLIRFIYRIIIVLEISLETKNLLEELANRYVNDSYKFFYANLIEIKNFTSIFWKNDLNNNVYLIRGKRKKYCVYKGKMDFNEISNFLDKVLSGGGTFKQLNQNFKFRNVKRDL